MSKYIFFNFPAHGHVNPTLAIVEELIARGEQVVYYLTEEFRQTIEATGATFRPFQSDLFRLMQPQAQAGDSTIEKRQLTILPSLMVRGSAQMLPHLLEYVQAEQADCLVYNAMFLWARFVA